MSLREARRLVAGELRGIDTETVVVVSAIALDETTSQKAVGSQSSGCSFVRKDKTVNLESLHREARRLVAAELRGIDTETVVIVSAIALDETIP